MFFKKKTSEERCESCNSKISGKYSYCPYCGSSIMSREDEAKEFGMLGKKDATEKELRNMPMPQNMGMLDKMMSSMINSLINNMAKNIEQQMKEGSNKSNTRITPLPNGIKISIGQPAKKQQKEDVEESKVRHMTDDQIKRMTSLPRANAKTSIRRFSDKVVYEIKAPGISSTNDVFVSKLENGYEIKALGDKKVYVNTLPIDLPISKYQIKDDKVLFEFPIDQEM